MKHITLLANPCVNLTSLDLPRRAFLGVNTMMEEHGKPPLFHVQIAGFEKEIRLENGMGTLNADVLIDELKKTDLIVIPAIDGDMQSGLKHCSKMIPWIVQQYNTGAELASLCIGAFLLAGTGLLNGKSCSTHWRAADEFRYMFPEVQLVTDRVITDENGIYTSGGSLSSANLVLYLIEKFAGWEVAVSCSKIFQVDIGRNSQSPFIIFHGQKDHGDKQIKQAQEFIEKNYGERISVDALTSMLALSRRNLERRFKKATSNTITEYVHRVKIEAAKKYLENSQKQVNEVMYDVGYQDTKAFRKIFRRITGLSPIEYRGRYNRYAGTA